MPKTFLSALGAAMALAVILLAAPPPASAQEGPLQSFFRQLFGGQPPQQQQAPQRQLQRDPSRPVYRQQQQQRRVRQQAPRQAQQPKVAQKAEDAKRVVVFGDFFAAGLREGLAAAFADSSGVVVEGVSDDSSGLAEAEPTDWTVRAQSYVADPEKRIDVAVVMLGANDRQELSDEMGDHAPRTERWRELYSDRVDALMDVFLARRIPVYWVGLPPVEARELSRDYAYFNEVFRERAYRAGAGFVDIWNSFLDEEGQYAANGPDVNGEQRQLRREDGLYFTDPGNRKLAHFVARDIRRDLEQDGELVVSLPSGPAGPRPFAASPQERSSGIGEVIPLTGATQVNSTLAGGNVSTPTPPRRSSYYRIILRGEAPEAGPGRNGDFTWPPVDETGTGASERSDLPSRPVRRGG